MADPTPPIPMPDEPVHRPGPATVYTTILPAASEPYQNGFTWRSSLGAVFVAAVMMPGIIFMGLMTGSDMGTAADWVTIILFMEICRRAFITLRKQELYLLKYTVSHLTHASLIGGGVFAALVHQRYQANSAEFQKFMTPDQIPGWFSPVGDGAFSGGFLTAVWLPAILVLIAAAVLMKLSQLSLGFLAFKMCNDVDRLPFPMAPIAAQGATALAEASADDGKTPKGYRQYCFAVALMIGAAFGVVFIGVPTISGTFLPQPIRLIPIPFLDLTVDLQQWFPGGTFGLAMNLGLIFAGFVLPWRIVVGSTVSCLITQLLVNPLLQRSGLLPTWAPGKSAVETQIATGLDGYMAVGIGMALVIAILGLWSTAKAFRRTDNGQSSIRRLWIRDVERGDPPTWLAVAVFLVASVCFVWLCHSLVPRFPLWVFLVFAFFWTPLNTYINARMSAITGAHANFPYIREGSIFLTGYRGPDVWFAPLPLQNYGTMSDSFKETELTRTRFTSLFKAELLVFPLMLVSSFLFWSYICGLGPVPSERYPHAEMFWPQAAQMNALWATSLQEGGGQMLAAINRPGLIAATVGVGLALFTGFGALGISTQYLYGAIGGMHALPHTAITIFAGAALGRYVLAKRFGLDRWTLYTPVLAAGFAAGVGLIGMLSIAIAFLVSSVSGPGY